MLCEGPEIVSRKIVRSDNPRNASEVQNEILSLGWPGSSTPPASWWRARDSRGQRDPGKRTRDIPNYRYTLYMAIIAVMLSLYGV